MTTMVLSGDEIIPELKSLVANTREKSENKFNDVLSSLKGRVLFKGVKYNLSLWARYTACLIILL